MCQFIYFSILEIPVFKIELGDRMRGLVSLQTNIFSIDQILKKYYRNFDLTWSKHDNYVKNDNGLWKKNVRAGPEFLPTLNHPPRQPPSSILFFLFFQTQTFKDKILKNNNVKNVFKKRKECNWIITSSSSSSS